MTLSFDVQDAPSLEPVTFQHAREHKFVLEKGKRGCGLVLGDGTRCAKAKNAVLHHGFPPSTNLFGSGADHWNYQDQKQRWMDLFEELLNASGLERGQGRIVVEGEWTFPRRAPRGGRGGPDAGNYRSPVEKYLGDALERGEWIAGDYWLAYQFDGASYRYEKDVCALRLTLFPMPLEDG
jgi:hypothetical protein